MNRDAWRRAQAIFEQVIDAPRSARRQLLAEVCGDRPELLEAVRALLESDDRTRALLDQPPAHALRAAIDDEMARIWIGRSVGSYKLLAKIGQGGMGQIFLAEREDRAFDKQVAVKIMSAATPMALERFHRERQILARLEHPGIARLLDGGTTPDGLPYVVMELVDGVSLTTYCTAKQLSLDDRLRLFERICEAVQYAHRNLVVHRDLKPGNILVDETGQAKLLDFGIAKLLTREGIAAADTVAAERALTPDYASPEQLAGETVTTASDVYSLGVVLYELLTGTTPARRRHETRGEARRPFAGETPELPSSGVAGQNDSWPITSRSLRGDLDNIVSTALRHEPHRRYSSVERLAADVGHYLAGLPVEARGLGLGYRAAKFVRRHAIAVSMTAATALLLIAFTLVTLFQARRIQAERDVSRQALSFLVEAFKGADPRVHLGREVTARDILARGAERLEVDQSAPSEVRFVLMHTLGQVYAGLGSYPEAKKWLERALPLGEQLHGLHDPRLGPILTDLGEVLLSTVDYHRAEAVARRALEVIPGDQPAPRVRAIHTLAEVHAGLNQWQESADRHADALALARDHLDASEPQLVRSLNGGARALRRLGNVDEAIALNSEALALQARYRPGDNAETSMLLAGSGGLWLRKGDLAQARENTLAGLAMRQRIYGDSHPAVARSLKTLATVTSREGDLEEAADLFRQTLAVFRTTMGEDDLQTTGARFEYAAFLHRKMNAPGRAEPLYRQATDSYEAVEGSETSSTFCYLLTGLGSALADLGRHAEAEPYWRRAREIRARRQEATIKIALATQLGLAEALAGQGKLAAAEREFAEAWEALRASHGLDDSETRRAGQGLAGIYQRTDREDRAAEIRQLLIKSAAPE